MDNNGQAVQNQVQEQPNGLYHKTLSEIRKLIPQGKFMEKENKSGITFFGDNKTRLLKMVETKKGLRIEFNVPVPKVDGLQTLSEEDAKEKHMGTCRWIYTGDNVEDVKKLVKEALTGFEPKKRSDAKDEKDKAPKVATPAQDKNAEKSGPVTTRKLTDAEKAELAKGSKSAEQKEKDLVQKIQGNKA
jgi:hypothetical protein